MSTNDGKKLYRSFPEAEQAAKSMRARFNENFSPYKVDGGWSVGGVHVRSKMPYRRVKSFSDIRALFDALDDQVSEVAVEEYASLIDAESNASKVSELNGDGEGWRLVSWEVLTGRQLEMNNDTSYLVVTVENETSQVLRLQMGGAFAKAIPLISAQAKSLQGQRIVWHTWNSATTPTKWQRSKWFYMLEAVDV